MKPALVALLCFSCSGLRSNLLPDGGPPDTGTDAGCVFTFERVTPAIAGPLLAWFSIAGTSASDVFLLTRSGPDLLWHYDGTHLAPIPGALPFSGQIDAFFVEADSTLLFAQTEGVVRCQGPCTNILYIPATRFVDFPPSGSNRVEAMCGDPSRPETTRVLAGSESQAWLFAPSDAGWVRTHTGRPPATWSRTCALLEDSYVAPGAEHVTVWHSDGGSQQEPWAGGNDWQGLFRYAVAGPAQAPWVAGQGRRISRRTLEGTWAPFFAPSGATNAEFKALAWTPQQRPDGCLVAGGGEATDGGLLVFEGATARALTGLEDFLVHALWFSPDGTLFVAGLDTRTGRGGLARGTPSAR